MNEWNIVTALVTLVSLGAAIMAPILKLNSTISKLSVLIDGALKDMVRLRSRLDDTEAEMHGIERRVTVLETKQA